MASRFPLSTIAFSVHEAITVQDEPMTADEITSFLRRVYEPSWELSDTTRAIAALIERGDIRQLRHHATPTYDTMRRNSRGKRCSPGPRNYDKTSPDYGWWTR